MPASLNCGYFICNVHTLEFCGRLTWPKQKVKTKWKKKRNFNCGKWVERYLEDRKKEWRMRTVYKGQNFEAVLPETVDRTYRPLCQPLEYADPVYVSTIPEIK